MTIDFEIRKPESSCKRSFVSKITQLTKVPFIQNSLIQGDTDLVSVKP